MEEFNRDDFVAGKEIRPTPGSDLAITRGCLCPVMDNFHGRGFGTPKRFWIAGNCPLHGKEEVRV